MATIAATGTTPPDEALADEQHVRAARPRGRRPTRLPSRPSPVWISSSTSIAPCRAAEPRRPRRGSRAAAARPRPRPAPARATTQASAVRASTSASAAASPNGTCATSGSSGRNGAWYSSLAVSASAPMVLPWNPPVAETSRAPAVRAGQLDRRLGRLGAGVDEVHEVQPLRRHRGQRRGRPGDGRVEHQPGRQRVPLHLVDDRGDDRAGAGGRAGRRRSRRSRGTLGRRRRPRAAVRGRPPPARR